MFGLPMWALKWGALALVLGGVWWHGQSTGRQSVIDRLKDDRITILKDGAKIDDQVESADRDELCRLLGGCLRDDAGGDEPL